MNKLVLFCIPLLLSCEHKESTLDFSEIEVGSDVRNYHFGKDFYNKKEITDEYYHYDIYDDTLYKKVTIEEVPREEKSTYYFPIDSLFFKIPFWSFYSYRRKCECLQWKDKIFCYFCPSKATF